MSTTVLMEWFAETSPQVKARVAGVFYLLTFVTGGMALFVSGALRVAAGNMATVCYVAVTLLFYEIFRPVSRRISLFAAAVSLTGCLIGALSSYDLVPSVINSLVFFGLYCLLIGYLIVRSTFVPRALGVLMALGGLGWLTFLWAPLAKALAPYNFAPGILGEGALTLWLLAYGVNSLRWKEQAGAGVE